MQQKNELLKQLCADVNMQEANNKGLITDNNLNENYFKVLTLYKKILNKYLVDTLNLKKYDGIIKTSELNFIPNSKENQDIYQYTSNMGMDYLYIRNNLFIERLTSNQLNLLIDAYDKNLVSKDVTDIVISTYKDVIKYYNDKPDSMNVHYGLFNPSFFAPNNSIVIGFNIDLFADNGLNDDEWTGNFFNQMEFINQFQNQMSVELKSKLDIPVTVIRYDENSIMKISEAKQKNGVSK
ncbi:MAG: hypothetical protein HFI86_00400 [Bacilli bacterium]|nr:hypothetical protein [Bacilli bacterium]